MICGDDVTNGKPHPEIFLKALDLFPDTQDAKDPGKVLVFEDSPNGTYLTYIYLHPRPHTHTHANNFFLFFQSCLLLTETNRDAGGVGITAALAGGFRAIHVPDADQSEPSTPADQTLKSLEEFRPEEWGLPPFK